MPLDHDRIATSICRTVAEIPDRSSPDDWPEAMLVTADELHTIVVCALENDSERQSHSLPGDVGIREALAAALSQALYGADFDTFADPEKWDFAEKIADDVLTNLAGEAK